MQNTLDANPRSPPQPSDTILEDTFDAVFPKHDEKHIECGKQPIEHIERDKTPDEHIERETEPGEHMELEKKPDEHIDREKKADEHIDREKKQDEHMSDELEKKPGEEAAQKPAPLADFMEEIAQTDVVQENADQFIDRLRAEAERNTALHDSIQSCGDYIDEGVFSRRWRSRGSST